MVLCLDRYEQYDGRIRMKFSVSAIRFSLIRQFDNTKLWSASIFSEADFEMSLPGHLERIIFLF